MVRIQGKVDRVALQEVSGAIQDLDFRALDVNFDERWGPNCEQADARSIVFTLLVTPVVAR